MEKILVDLSEKAGKIKPMHAVNNGPQNRYGIDNSESFREAGIPYARTHDAAFFSGYGGEHTVDVAFIFPNFDADPCNPENYDFIFTDEYMRHTYAAGTKIFYRLGAKIEHEVKKYNIHPPKDYKKWAVICEHIIRHYTEGWADGFYYDMKYWEIWNEPDLKDLCWTGTEEEFFELFAVAADHLKSCFPKLKIGGPAVTNPMTKWIDRCLAYLSDFHGKRVPLDFFSWHEYDRNPHNYAKGAANVRRVLDEYGYTEAESILNEWNYVTGWRGDDFKYSVYSILGMKGAAFTSASMSVAQTSSIDLLMYYDARPCNFNGLFDDYNNKMKGYYPFFFFNKLYEMGNGVKSHTDDSTLYVTSASDGNGKSGIFVTYFDDDDNANSKDISIDVFGLCGKGEAKIAVYLLDSENDGELLRIEKTKRESYSLPLTLCNFSLAYIEIEKTKGCTY